MVIFPAFPAKGRVVAVVNITVTAAAVTCMGFMSASAMTIETPDTAATLGAGGGGGGAEPRPGVAAPALTASVAVFTVKPVADPAVAAPVVSSQAAKVILCAPAAKSAVAVSQTMVRVAAVKVQVAVSVAVPPAAGTRTPAGAAFKLK